MSWNWRSILTFLFILRVSGQEEEEQEGNLLFKSNSYGDLVLSIPGIPGEDYPVHSFIPKTSFSCEGKRNGGLYGDPETDCQIFHICGLSTVKNVDKFSFFCPSGTIFNQDHLICDWWFNFDCSLTESLYSRNEEKVQERKRKKKSLKEQRVLKTTTTITTTLTTTTTTPQPLIPTVLPTHSTSTLKTISTLTTTTPLKKSHPQKIKKVRKIKRRVKKKKRIPRRKINYTKSF